MKNVFAYTMLGILVLSTVGMTLMSPFSQNYSTFSETGVIHSLRKEGAIFRTWKAEFISSTKDSSDSSSEFVFYILNDDNKNPLRQTLDSAAKNTWKLKLNFYKVFGYNQLTEKASEKIFVQSIEILDREYAVNKELEERDLGSSVEETSLSTEEQALDTVETGRDTTRVVNGKDTVVYIVVYKDSAHTKN
jgi:hypothetical protein